VSNIITAITSPIQLMMKLLETIKKYRASVEKKKRTESRFIKAFENEIKAYVDVFQKLYKLSEEEIVPIIGSIGDEFTPHQMNELLQAMSEMPLIQADFIKAFIAFAKACSEVTAIKGLMENLKEANIVLYDFVWAMKNTYVEEDRVKISRKYYRFFKTYEDDIFKEVENDDLKEMADKLKGYTKKVKHYVDKTAFIRRNVRKKWMRNMRVLNKATAKLSVERTSIVDVRMYIPQKLLPITIMFDELSP